MELELACTQTLHLRVHIPIVKVCKEGPGTVQGLGFGALRLGLGDFRTCLELSQEVIPKLISRSNPSP